MVSHQPPPPPPPPLVFPGPCSKLIMIRRLQTKMYDQINRLGTQTTFKRFEYVETAHVINIFNHLRSTYFFLFLFCLWIASEKFKWAVHIRPTLFPPFIEITHKSIWMDRWIMRPKGAYSSYFCCQNSNDCCSTPLHWVYFESAIAVWGCTLADVKYTVLTILFVALFRIMRPHNWIKNSITPD